MILLITYFQFQKQIYVLIGFYRLADVHGHLIVDALYLDCCVRSKIISIKSNINLMI
jgi:hypothetical protein